MTAVTSYSSVQQPLPFLSLDHCSTWESRYDYVKQKYNLINPKEFYEACEALYNIMNEDGVKKPYLFWDLRRHLENQKSDLNWNKCLFAFFDSEYLLKNKFLSLQIIRSSDSWNIKDEHYRAINKINTPYDDEIEKQVIEVIQHWHGVDYAFRWLTIHNPENKFALAKEVTVRNPNHSGVSKNFQLDKKQLIEIAKLAWPQRLDEFGIEDESDYIEIAKEHSKYYANNLLFNIEKYKITNKEALYEIALLCVERDPGAICECIHKLGFERQDWLEELARRVAKKNGSSTSKHIQDFKIKDQNSLNEIALLCLDSIQDKSGFDLQNFGITDQALFSKILNILLEKVPRTVVYSIDDWRGIDRSLIYEAVNKLIDNHFYDLMYKLHKLLPDVNDRINLLLSQVEKGNNSKTCLEGLYYFHLGNHLDYYRAFLFALNTCTEKNFSILASYENYLEYQRLALMVANKYAKEKSLNQPFKQLSLLNIKDKTERLKIAQLIAEKCTGDDIKNIKQFGIDDEMSLYEVASYAARRNADFPTFVQNFEINNLNLLKNLAKACLRFYRFKSVFENLHHFNLTKEEDIGDILQTAIDVRPTTTMFNFKYIHPKPCYSQAKDVILASMAKKLNTSLNNSPYFFSSYKDERPQEIDPNSASLDYISFRLTPNCLIHEETWKLLEYYGIKQNINIKSILYILIYKKQTSHGVAYLTKEKFSDHIIEQNIKWFLKSLFKLHYYPKISLVNWNQYKPFIFDIFSYSAQLHNPAIRKVLVDIAWKVADNENAYAYFQGLRHRYKANHLFFPLLLCAFLFARGTPRTFTDKVLLNAFLKLNKELKNCILHDAVYRVIGFINENEDLPSSSIRAIILIIFSKLLYKNDLDKKNIIEKANVLTSIGNLAGIQALSCKALVSHYTDVKGYFADLFLSKIPLKSNKSLFYDRYNATFGRSRDVTAAMRYGTALNKLKDENARKNCLENFAFYMDQVLADATLTQFYNTRVDITQNAHLQKIHAYDPKLISQWQKNYSENIDNLEIELISDLAFSIEDYFIIKIVRDKHIELPLVVEYLEGDSNKKEAILKQVSAPSSTDLLSKYIIDCTLPTFKHLNVEKQKHFIDNIIKLINPDTHSTFINDLEILKINLSKDLLESHNQLVEITNNPFDLLLCGTEIKGSCQSVDGSEYFNKGLLGYLLDGKNMLIVIRTSDNKLEVRALFRLLWDEEANKPVLLLSRIYPYFTSQQQKSVIVHVAKERAKKLGFDLVSVEVSKGEKYPNALKSLGGPAAYEYSDESFGLQKNGIFVVEKEKAHYLWKAPQTGMPATN